MHLRTFAIAFAGLVLCSVSAHAQAARISNVDPASAKPGDLVTANGDGVGAGNVDELYLTNGSQDIKVEITEQTQTLIKFKVPAGVKPGRWALMTHLKSGSGPRLIEHPVKLTVDQ